jgi:transitional endoplasmic reticulum ATPase
MLTELSGLEDLHDVVVIAATNRPDMLDPALIRPGRLDRKILVPGPDEEAKLKILQIKTQNVPLKKNIDLKKLAKELGGFSGADIENLIREAAIIALRRDEKSKNVTKKDFEEALEIIKPSLNKEVDKFYRQFDERSKRKFTTTQESDELKYFG